MAVAGGRGADGQTPQPNLLTPTPRVGPREGEEACAPRLGCGFSPASAPPLAAGHLLQATQPPWAVAARALDRSTRLTTARGALRGKQSQHRREPRVSGWKQLLMEASVPGPQAQDLRPSPQVPPAPSAGPHGPGQGTAPAELSGGQERLRPPLGIEWAPVCVRDAGGCRKRAGVFSRI